MELSTEERKEKRKKTLVTVAAVICGVLLIGLSVISCGNVPTDAERFATATTYALISETRKAVVHLTQTAEPTRIPRAPADTPTPDTRSPFEKCVESGRGVRYVIAGEGVDAVSLTWENDSGGSNQGDYNVPLCKTYTNFEDGDFLYISAQIILGGGQISCYIYDGNSVIARANASGFASIATCSGSVE